MKAALKPFILLFLLFTGNQLFAQASFTMNIWFRFFSGDGKALAENSFSNNICIYPEAGEIEEYRFDSRTKYYYVKINTTWPVFTIVWKHKKEQMRICIDHATGYKDVYLDSIAFKPGDFLIRGNLGEYISTEDRETKHLLFRDMMIFRSSESAFERYGKGNKKCM